MDIIDRINRRLEVLARERMSQLKPGFSATPEGKLCYAPQICPSDNQGRDNVEPVAHCVSGVIGAVTTIKAFKVGDRVQVKAGVKNSHFASGNVGTVGIVRDSPNVRVVFDPGQEGLTTDLVSGSFWWVMRDNLVHYLEARFDPMTEPLQVGDIVRVVLNNYSKKGHVGEVLCARPDISNDHWFVRVEGVDTPFVQRSSLELLSRPA